MSLSIEGRAQAGDLELEVALSVDAGETLAVLGPNGAGKTTLLKALVGLLPLTSGTITLDGRVLDDPVHGTFVPVESRSIGVVFQDLLLFPTLDVVDNVAFGLRGDRRSARGGPCPSPGVARSAGARRPGEIDGSLAVGRRGAARRAGEGAGTGTAGSAPRRAAGRARC